jgi:ribosomal protein S18 acetylase RimI-like enzyme
MRKIPGVSPFDDYEIRAYRPDDVASLYVVHAAIAPTDAGQLLAWTEALEARLEMGGRAWVMAHGRRLAGYATTDPVPGLPGVYELTGGIVPSRRQQGLGARLLAHVQAQSASLGIRQLSCRIDNLDDEVAAFLLRRGFFVEHEECLLELADLSQLPPIPAVPPGDLATYPESRVVVEFCRVYNACFVGVPWSQPYTEMEVAASLARPDDLLFLTLDGKAVGVVWLEILPDGRGRIEPIGIAHPYQGQGHGRRLLLAALHSLRHRGAGIVEIGLWRQNAIAMNLYQSLGFTEADNWYYLACDIEGLKAE